MVLFIEKITKREKNMSILKHILKWESFVTFVHAYPLIPTLTMMPDLFLSSEEKKTWSYLTNVHCVSHYWIKHKVQVVSVNVQSCYLEMGSIHLVQVSLNWNL